MFKAVAAAIVLTAFAQSPDHYDALWKQFKKDYNKSYPADSNGNDEQTRFEIFKDNVKHIEATNAKKLSYWLAINEFSDLTSEEFFATHLGYDAGGKKVMGLEKVPFPTITDVADSADWVSKGAVTPVKNQAQCGSCWAFSATGSIEGALFVASGKLVSLSEEDLVQCDNGGSGCQGGIMDQAFGWVAQNGIASEAAYPYTSGAGVTGRCNSAKEAQAVVTLTGHTDVPPGNENALKAAVSQQPVSIAIEADRSAFQSYRGGILDNPACGKQLDHGVLIVGYGTDGGKDYWRVKNSWGASWGEQGYIRMVRGKDQCGLATEPSYPTGVKAAGPSPGPSPPSPSPPSPPSPSGGHHYEDPKGGCRSDEVDIQIQGVQGSICTPACPALWPIQHCATDVPDGVTATPQCALQDASSKKRYCALICTPGSNDACGTNASCKSISGTGICTYDDAKDTEAIVTAKYAPEEEQVVV